MTCYGKDALYHPDDMRTPYSLLFDTRTWTPIQPVPVKRFRRIYLQGSRRRSDRHHPGRIESAASSQWAHPPLLPSGDHRQ